MHALPKQTTTTKEIIQVNLPGILKLRIITVFLPSFMRNRIIDQHLPVPAENT